MKFLKSIFAVGLLSAVLAAPAQAYTLTHGGGGYGYVTNQHWLNVCDTQVDGHRVRLWYTTFFSDKAHPSITGWAPSRGCHREGSIWGDRVFQFRVCIEAEGCTGWSKMWPRPARR